MNVFNPVSKTLEVFMQKQVRDHLRFQLSQSLCGFRKNLTSQQGLLLLRALRNFRRQGITKSITKGFIYKDSPRYLMW